MATFYLDFVGGNDANDGTTFANRWKTVTSGATAARIAPGDVIRVMASPDPTSLGQTATWTQYSKTITLTTAVTQTIDDGEAAWTASANVTSTADATLYKEGTKSAKHTIAAGFTTGLASFKATGTLDLSGYQQVSFWIYNNAVIADGATLSLRLCSDVAGVTTVNTIAIPAIPSTGTWVPVVVDTGGALGSSIKSVALYCDKDPGTIIVQLDDIIACKASSAADSLNLTSLIGKAWNLNWAASTAYAANDIRKPTNANRNGFRYQVTAGGGGNSGATEPTWPLGIGSTVSDGALTWTCEGLEDTWYGIQSINGTTVKLDNVTSTRGDAGRGYAGATETVTTYKRETIKTTMVTGATAVNTFQDSGTDGSLITYSGGWNRTDMSTQTGETWTDGQNTLGSAYVYGGRLFLRLNNLNGVRYSTFISDLYRGWELLNVHACNCDVGIASTSVVAAPKFVGVQANNGGTAGFRILQGGVYVMWQVAANSAITAGINNTSGNTTAFNINTASFKNCGTYGVALNGNYPVSLSGVVTANGGNGIGMLLSPAVSSLNNCSIGEATKFSAMTSPTNQVIYSNNHQQSVGSHLITTDGGTIGTSTTQRHTASGFSWLFNPTSTLRGAYYPMTLSVAKIACVAGAAVSVNIWTYRDSTDINGALRIHGGQIAGVDQDVSVTCAPTINTWTQSSTLTFTPSADGVVEIVFDVYDGVGTTNSFWIDDLTVTQ